MSHSFHSTRDWDEPLLLCPSSWPFLVTVPDTAGVLMSFTLNATDEENNEVFQFIRLVLVPS
jgi:hypothetical protein